MVQVMDVGDYASMTESAMAYLDVTLADTRMEGATMCDTPDPGRATIGTHRFQPRRRAVGFFYKP